MLTKDYSKYEEIKEVRLGYQVIIVLMLLLSLVMLVCFATILAFPGTDDTTTNYPDNWKEPENIWAYGEQVSGQPSSSENTDDSDDWVDAPPGYWGAPVPDDAIWIP